MPDAAISEIAPTPETSRRGLILINTGPGKGKTTAALGTAFRAAGNGMSVLFLQFLKGSWHYGELDAAQALNSALAPAPIGPVPDNFVIKQLGRGFVKVGSAETDPEDIRLVEAAWAESAAAILSGDWDLVVLDEINYAIGYHMLSAESVAEVLRAKPEMTHVILTGRNAHPLLVELADTVTEMREVKHAYQRGILAQRGIEF
jgi:cob(I)alamin adenosyltransferase